MSSIIASTPILNKEDSMNFIRNLISFFKEEEAKDDITREKERQEIEDSYNRIASLIKEGQTL